jgi:hypothetical protein
LASWPFFAAFFIFLLGDFPQLRLLDHNALHVSGAVAMSFDAVADLAVTVLAKGNICRRISLTGREWPTTLTAGNLTVIGLGPGWHFDDAISALQFGHLIFGLVLLDTKPSFGRSFSISARHNGDPLVQRRSLIHGFRRGCG